MAKIIVKKANDDNFFTMDVPEREVWHRMQELVGEDGETALLDRVHLLDPAYTFTLYCDEEGLLKKQPLNILIKTNHPFQPIMPIVGTICFARGRIVEDDVEYTDVTDLDIATVANLIEMSKILEERMKEHE